MRYMTCTTCQVKRAVRQEKMEMKLKLQAARYMYFTKNIGGMIEFYIEKLGFEVMSPLNSKDLSKEGFIQINGGGFEIALHKASNPGCSGRNRNKLVFYVRNVESARKTLIGRKVKLGKIYGEEGLQLCDGKDPDGNVFQISNRKILA